MPKRIKLRGPLISNNQQEAYDWFGMEAVSAKSISNAMPDDGSDIVLVLPARAG